MGTISCGESLIYPHNSNGMRRTLIRNFFIGSKMSVGTGAGTGRPYPLLRFYSAIFYELSGAVASSGTELASSFVRGGVICWRCIEIPGANAVFFVSLQARRLYQITSKLGKHIGTALYSQT